MSPHPDQPPYRAHGRYIRQIEAEIDLLRGEKRDLLHQTAMQAGMIGRQVDAIADLTESNNLLTEQRDALLARLAEQTPQRLSVVPPAGA